MKLFFTRNSIRKLTQIEDYQRSSGNAKKGRETVRDIRNKAKMLETNSELGPLEENFNELSQGHRSLLVGTLYKIVYLIKQPVIFITDIFDVRQDPNKMKS
jgi:plasmid stabilization system protein ParE